MLGEAFNTVWAALAAPAQALMAGAVQLLLAGLVFAGVALLARGSEALRRARAAAGEVRINLWLYVLDVIFLAPVLTFLVLEMGRAMAAHGVHVAAPSLWAHAPAWVTVIAALFVGDFVAYWRHRLEHAPWLWPFHAVHHSDRAMTWTTLFRFHPVNRVSTALIDAASLALLGFPPWALVINTLTRHYYGMFIHMDLPWSYGPLGRVLVSPTMHRWHHVREGPGVGANFATLFSVFDQAFGTYYVPGPCEAPLGVREDMPGGVRGQLLIPFRQFAALFAAPSRAAAAAD